MYCWYLNIITGSQHVDMIIGSITDPKMHGGIQNYLKTFHLDGFGRVQARLSMLESPQKLIEIINEFGCTGSILISIGSIDRPKVASQLEAVHTFPTKKTGRETDS